MRSSGTRVAGAFLLWLVAVLACAANAPPGAVPFTRGLLFRVEAPGKPPSYVFGTIHSSDPRVTQLPAPVSEALAASRRLAPEVLLSQGDLPDFYAAAQFDDHRRLVDYFDADTLAKIERALGADAPAPAVLAKLKPWALLPMLAYRGPDGGAPTLDEVLVGEGRRRRMHVFGLELPDEQVASFDTIPVATQVALVQWTLDHRAQLPADHEAAIAAWRAGDLQRLAALASAPGRADPAMAPHFAQLMQHLVDNRTILMAHRLFLPLREGRVFVAVGALHLYGRHGLLALIRAQGYRITRIY